MNCVFTFVRFRNIRKSNSIWACEWRIKGELWNKNGIEMEMKTKINFAFGVLHKIPRNLKLSTRRFSRTLPYVGSIICWVGKVKRTHTSFKWYINGHKPFVMCFFSYFIFRSLCFWRSISKWILFCWMKRVCVCFYGTCHV